MGSLTFTVPITSLSVAWVATGAWVLGNISSDYSAGPVIENFTGLTDSIRWGNYYGYSGIESMTYTEEPVSTGEPSSLLLSAMGLAALIQLARK